VLYEEGEFLHALQTVTWGLSILKFAANISVAISEELLLTILVHREDLDISFANALAVMGNLQFTESFIDHYLKARRVERLELLLADSSDLDNQIHVL